MRDENKLSFESGKYYYCVEARKLVDISYSPYSQQLRERKKVRFTQKKEKRRFQKLFFTKKINRFTFLILKAYEKKK